MRHCVHIECKIKTDPENAVLFHGNQVNPFLEVVLSSLRISGAEYLEMDRLGNVGGNTEE
jgi:hypothetical protein